MLWWENFECCNKNFDWLRMKKKKMQQFCQKFIILSWFTRNFRSSWKLCSVLLFIICIWWQQVAVSTDSVKLQCLIIVSLSTAKKYYRFCIPKKLVLLKFLYAKKGNFLLEVFFFFFFTILLLYEHYLLSFSHNVF